MRSRDVQILHPLLKLLQQFGRPMSTRLHRPAVTLPVPTAITCTAQRMPLINTRLSTTHLVLPYSRGLLPDPSQTSPLPYSQPFTQCTDFKHSENLKMKALFKSLRQNNVILLFNKDALYESKVTVNTFIMLQKIYISNKCCSFVFSIH